MNARCRSRAPRSSVGKGVQATPTRCLSALCLLALCLLALCLLALCLPTSGCQDGSARATAAQAANVPTFSVLLPWGAVGAREPGTVGLRVAQEDWPSDGPSALAALPVNVPGGEGVLLLDRHNSRVVWASPKSARALVEVPQDSEDLATGPDGAFVTHSLLRGRAFLFHDGAPAGEVAIDRSLRELTSISLQASRRVSVANAHQETFGVGSPSAPQTLTAALHGKRKGAYFMDDGTGVSVRVDGLGRPELWLMDNGPAGNTGPRSADARTSARSKLPLLTRGGAPETVLSARIVGVVDDIACLRLEERGQGAEAAGATLRVTRRAVCHELRTGTRVFERALGAPGSYRPRRDLAMASSPARLLYMHPEDKGLRVFSWTLPTAPAPSPGAPLPVTATTEVAR